MILDLLTGGLDIFTRRLGPPSGIYDWSIIHSQIGELFVVEMHERQYTLQYRPVSI